MRNVMYPIRTPEDKKSFAVLDIESIDWINFLCIGYYSGTHEFCYFDDMIKCFDFLVNEQKEDTFFIHYGGKYDFLIIVDELIKKIPNLELVMIPRGSLVLNMELKYKGKKLNFWDSTALLPFSLRDIATKFDVPVKKGNIDYEKIEKITSELIDYLKSDCIALYQCLEKFYSWDLIQATGRGKTLAGQALKILRGYLNEPIYSLSKSQDEFIRKSYFGGRTEIFKPYCDNQMINCYDINSLYPYVMQKFDYPIRFSFSTNKFYKDRIGFYDCEVTAPKGIYLPILPYKILSDNTIKIDDSKTKTDKNIYDIMDGIGKLIFPIGTFRGVYTIHELNFAIKRGYKINKIYDGMIFERKKNLFTKFVNDIYAIRKKAEKNSFDDIMGKLILNSSYGKFGINLEKENIVIDNGEKGLKDWIVFKKIKFSIRDVELDAFTNVAIASYVTSYARTTLYEKFELVFAQNKYNLINHIKYFICYTDTDSIFTNATLEIGNKLGDLKLEKSDKPFCGLLPKTYIHGNKAKLKGFDSIIAKYTIDEFRETLKGSAMLLQFKPGKGIKSFKQAMKSGKLLQKKKLEIKRLLAKYDKRIIINKNKEDLNLWETKPIEI